MKTKSTLTAALMVLSAFVGSFLAGALLNQDEVAAATYSRYSGWRGHDTSGQILEFFILDTTSGEVDWFRVSERKKGSSQMPSTVDVHVFRFKHGSATGQQIR